MSGEDTINAALKFLEHVYKEDSPFSGTVRFVITDSATAGSSFTKYICVTAGHGMQVFDVLDTPADCNILVDRIVLLAILTGTLDPAIALMWGQLSLDNILVMSEFAKAFDLSPQRFTDFQLSLVTEGAQPNGADAIPAVPVLPPVNNSNIGEKLPLKQALAIQTLHLLASCNNIRKDIDSLITRVKERENVKKAFDNLDAKMEEFQATPTYRNLQSNAIYVTLRTELERASIGATVVGHKAKDMGEELVGRLTMVAYPPTNQQQQQLHDNVSVVATSEGGFCANADPSAVNIDIVEDKRELKRLQLQQKLEKLKQYNEQMNKERAQRLASKR